MPAPGKSPDQTRKRAIRLVPGVAGEAGNVTAAGRRIGKEPGINADTRRGRVTMFAQRLDDLLTTEHHS